MYTARQSQQQLGMGLDLRAHIFRLDNFCMHVYMYACVCVCVFMSAHVLEAIAGIGNGCVRYGSVSHP